MFNQLANSQSAVIMAKRLWPTMLFLVVMTLFTGGFARYWTSSMENPIHGVIAFYFWFGACLICTMYGVVAFYKDIKIQSASAQ